MVLAGYPIRNFLLTIGCWISMAVVINAQDPSHFFIGQDEFANTEVYSLKQHPNGLLYAATDHGLFVYRHGSFFPIEYNCEHLGSSLFDLTLDANGSLYCCNLSGQVFVLNGSVLDHFTTIPKEYLNTSWLNFTFDEQNRLIFSSKIVGRENGSGWDVFTDPVLRSNRLNGSDPSSILIFDRSDSTTYSFGGNRLEPIRNFGSSFEQSAQILPVNTGGSIQLITSHFGYVDENGQFLNYPNPEFVGDVDQDESGIIWLRPNRLGGVMRGQVFEDSISFSEPLFTSTHISAITEADDGTIFLGTLGNGVLVVPSSDCKEYEFDGSRIRSLVLLPAGVAEEFSPKLSGQQKVLKAYPEFNLELVASESELYYEPEVSFNTFEGHPNILQQLHQPVGQRIGPIKAVEFVGNRSAVVATSFGLYKVGPALEHIDWQKRYSDSDWSRLHEADLRCGSVAYISASKELVYSTQTGTFSVDDQGIEHEILFNDRPVICKDLVVESDRVICATDQHGVLVVSSGKVIDQISLEQGLRERSVNMLEVGSGHLYIAHRSGVQIMDLVSGDWSFVSELSVLRKAVKDLMIWNHELWVVTGNTVISAPLLGRSNSNFRLHVGDPYLGDQVHDAQSEISVAHNLNSFRLDLDFRGILFEKSALIEYQLNDAGWKQIPATSQMLEFESLSPGSYHLKLRVNYFGEISEERSFSFKIRPPFWMTWWFYSAMFCLMTLVLVAVYRYRLKRNEIRQKLITDKLESELKALRSQMNPHFIFNSLNSIQDLVMREDTRNTYDYIVLFAKLVRNTLNYSSLDHIAIEKELEFLEVYLSLEKLRFQDEFTYSIKYDGPSGIEVPSLLVQPFLENALVHGLMHKHGEKRLDIQFLVKDRLEIVINDNGIGRKKAKEILKRQRGDHWSFATEAIEQRLNLINEHSGSSSAGFEIIDLHEGEEPSGTQVVINLPLRTDEDFGN